MTSADTRTWIGDNTVGRNLQLFKNSGGLSVGVYWNGVGGNLQVFRTTGDAVKTVAENAVGGNLQCRRNDEAFTGGPNFPLGTPNDDSGNQCFFGDLEE